MKETLERRKRLHVRHSKAMTGSLVPGCVRQPLRIIIRQRRDVMSDPIDLFAIHEEKGAQLLLNLDTHSPQISAGMCVAPWLPSFLFLHFWAGTIDAHHCPFFMGTRPHGRVRGYIVYR